MKIYGNLNGTPCEPFDIEDKALCMHFTAETCGHDIFRRLYMLNLVRPVTRWRRLRAFLGLHEKDTMRSGFRNKPTLIKHPKPTLEALGKQVMRAATFSR